MKGIILEIYNKRKILGYRRLQTVLLRRTGQKVNHKRVYRLMRELNIKSIIRRPRYPNRIRNNQLENNTKIENILKRNFKADKPIQKLVTDITYLIFGNQRLYLSVIQDLFNNEIIGYQIGRHNDIQLVTNTITDVIDKKKDVTGTIIHSDQGYQYTSKEYNKLLKQYGIIQSMSRKGNCLDNAAIESFFSHFKCEAFYPSKVQTIEEAISVVEEYIYFYNNERYQKRLDQMAPVEYRHHFEKAA